MHYTYKLWDRISPINGCPAKDTGLLDCGEVYLILLGDRVGQTLSNEDWLFEGMTLLQSVQKICDDMNVALEAEQFYNDTKTAYTDGTITDEQFAELVEVGKLTQSQADEIKEIKMEVLK